jgi:pimeloyl-ACP methyl ester carboxylesterase
METIINGCRMGYDDSGETNLAPVIFIHAFPLNRSMWRGQIDALKGNARRIAYDVRGFGESDAGDGLNPFEIFVDDLFALMDRLKLEKAALCGLSMGGYIALRAIERSPERVSALVLCDTRSEADGNEAKVKRAMSMKAVKQGGAAAFAETFVKLVFAVSTQESQPELVEHTKMTIGRTSPIAIRGAMMAMTGRTDTTAALAAIKAPTLILVGEHDAVTPVAASQSMAEKIKGAELRVIPGAGHMSNLENPAEFNRWLSAFAGRF